ncbi:thiamine ABC transporter substrate-binding protein [Streptomyces sp. TRM 70351]|uniref:thiamine ABC transporter substrate-binding protein n=1 Tax=Streptomyces sp. TRM 70351 TaxID=3116552 RepID=UPI002E7B606A|nr:thiamine ABC transporter substrate-binding protein [Streptomyces sp. TRM 70351]MEE1931121.1 thiamine ABC transporter substrate-binding protein [Streptomyces sp. TRM 70351]
MRTTTTFRGVLAAALGTALLAGCGSGGGDGTSETVTLVTHNSFAVSEEVLARFTEETGYTVEVVRGGDAGVTVNKAVLSAGNPEGDVLFGVDNTMLSKALDADVFTPYEAEGLAEVDEAVRLDDRHRVTPVDTGDVCVNYDRAWFEERGTEPPQTLDDLTDPVYRDLLVVQNPATSSPGLAFLLATVGAYGEDGWQEYWKDLKANGAEQVDGWEQAYNDRFSGSSAGRDGDRPLVVSYASSPPAEVYYGGDARPEQAPTGVATGTCFQQTEFAGLLRGADNTEGGEALLDFLISPAFQEDVPLQMFVRPVRGDAELPEVFTRYGATVEEPHRVASERIDENREQWIEQWSALMR